MIKQLGPTQFKAMKEIAEEMKKTDESTSASKNEYVNGRVAYVT